MRTNWLFIWLGFNFVYFPLCMYLMAKIANFTHFISLMNQYFPKLGQKFLKREPYVMTTFMLVSFAQLLVMFYFYYNHFFGNIDHNYPTHETFILMISSTLLLAYTLWMFAVAQYYLKYKIFLELKYRQLKKYPFKVVKICAILEKQKVFNVIDYIRIQNNHTTYLGCEIHLDGDLVKIKQNGSYAVFHTYQELLANQSKLPRVSI